MISVVIPKQLRTNILAGNINLMFEKSLDLEGE